MGSDIFAFYQQETVTIQNEKSMPNTIQANFNLKKKHLPTVFTFLWAYERKKCQDFKKSYYLQKVQGNY